MLSQATFAGCVKSYVRIGLVMQRIYYLGEDLKRIAYIAKREVSGLAATDSSS